MNLRAIFLVFLGLLLLSGRVMAQQQAPMFDSLKITPENPTDNDELKLSCYATFLTSDCQLDSTSVNLQGDTIFLPLHYNVGEGQAICHSMDTVSLGQLSEGHYVLIPYMTINLLEAVFDTDTIEFTVGQHLDIGETNLDNRVVLYPNPVGNYLTIKTGDLSEKYLLEIYSILGCKVIEQDIIGTTKMSLSVLSDGIYMVVLTDSKGEQIKKKIVKHSR